MVKYVTRDEAALWLVKGAVVWYWFEGEDEGAARGYRWIGWTAPMSYARKNLSRRVAREKRYSFAPKWARVFYKVITQ